jgi:hypothetical protein
MLKGMGALCINWRGISRCGGVDNSMHDGGSANTSVCFPLISS